MTSDEGEVPPPPAKKARASSEKTVTTEVEEPVLPEDAPVLPPPPKKTLRKRKETASTAAPATSASQGHVSAVVVSFSFITILTRVAPEPMLGCSQPRVGLLDVRVLLMLFCFFVLTHLCHGDHGDRLRRPVRQTGSRECSAPPRACRRQVFSRID